MGWYLARSLRTLRDQINEVAPERSKRSDGSIGNLEHSRRRSDHNPLPPTNVVLALDITDDPLGGWSCKDFSEILLATRPASLKYVIYDGRMFSSYSTRNRKSWEWGPYGGSNKHRTHLHLSLKNIPELYDDVGPWEILEERFEMNYLRDARSHTIKLVQRGLIQLGYHGGAVTGKMDEPTRAAIEGFNGSHGELQDDGDALSERGLQLLTLRVALKRGR